MKKLAFSHLKYMSQSDFLLDVARLHNSQECWVTIQANVQFHPQMYSGPLPRRLITHTAGATETSANKPILAAFSAGVAYKMPSYN